MSTSTEKMSQDRSSQDRGSQDRSTQDRNMGRNVQDGNLQDRASSDGRTGGYGLGDGSRGVGRKQGGGHMSLVTETGKTKIADGVVAKIAGLAAKDIPGVHSMGTGMARRMGQLKSLVGGGEGSAAQGVAVEVGEKEAAVDLDLVTNYGQSIVDVTSAVREHVIEQVEGMTGLKVVEVNITVDDVFVESEAGNREEEQRVQ